MAASSLPEPGTKYGPCVPDCAHVDCAATRRMAAQICRLCGTAIGYDKRFYTDPDDRAGLVHAVCLETSVEEERRARRLSAIGHKPGDHHLSGDPIETNL